MSVQSAANVSNIPFILSGMPYTKNGETYLQDASRSAALAYATVLATVLAAAGSVTADAGNTGDGTVTAFALTKNEVPQVGDWNLECIAAVTNGGTFKLEDPAGNIIANDIVMTAGAGAATTFIVAGMTFIITDGATDFIVGDKFALTVSAVNKRTALDVTGVAGAQYPTGIYLGDAITAADIVAGDVDINSILVAGSCSVDSGQIVLEGSATLDTVLDNGKSIRQALYEIGLIPEDTQDSSYYENA